MGERCTVEGAVQNIIFQNEENGYTVLCLVTDEGEAITVVGCIPCAAAGERMTVTGAWVNHPSYGTQLTAESVERRMPEGEDEIAAYLASGIIKGVGPATAAQLMKAFKSLKRAKEADYEQLADAIGAAKARILYAHFHPDS